MLEYLLGCLLYLQTVLRFKVYATKKIITQDMVHNFGQSKDGGADFCFWISNKKKEKSVELHVYHRMFFTHINLSFVQKQQRGLYSTF